MAIPKILEDLRRSRLLLTPEEVEHRLPATLATGLEELDRLLGGGLPLGRIAHFPGESLGATSMALSIVARGTSEGRLVAWVDRADAFDPRGAREAGVELSRLLWCRPREDRDAIRAADAILASGAFSLVVLDFRVERPRLVGQGAWLRLSRGAESRRSSLLVLGDVGAETFSAVTLRPEGSGALFCGVGPGRTFEGLRILCRLERNKLGLPPGEASFSFRAPPHLPPLTLDPAPGALRASAPPSASREGR